MSVDFVEVATMRSKRERLWERRGKDAGEILEDDEKESGEIIWG